MPDLEIRTDRLLLVEPCRPSGRGSPTEILEPGLSVVRPAPSVCPRAPMIDRQGLLSDLRRQEEPTPRPPPPLPSRHLPQGRGAPPQGRSRALSSPPEYAFADFLKPSYQRLRGPDVPKERFVRFRGMSRDHLPTVLVGRLGCSKCRHWLKHWRNDIHHVYSARRHPVRQQGGDSVER